MLKIGVALSRTRHWFHFGKDGIVDRYIEINAKIIVYCLTKDKKRNTLEMIDKATKCAFIKNTIIMM